MCRFMLTNNARLKSIWQENTKTTGICRQAAHLIIHTSESGVARVIQPVIEIRQKQINNQFSREEMWTGAKLVCFEE